MKHIFLTGEPGIGKTTIINCVLEEERLTIKGFRTKKEAADPNGTSVICLCACGKEYFHSWTAVACRYERGGFCTCPGAFDDAGVAALENNTDADLILMDELGFMESEAYRFQEKVIEVLNGSIPVLGVVKPWETKFLSRVKSHPDVSVFEITKENRDFFAAILREMLLSIITGK